MGVRIRRILRIRGQRQMGGNLPGDMNGAGVLTGTARRKGRIDTEGNLMIKSQAYSEGGGTREEAKKPGKGNGGKRELSKKSHKDAEWAEGEERGSTYKNPRTKEGGREAKNRAREGDLERQRTPNNRIQKGWPSGRKGRTWGPRQKTGEGGNRLRLFGKIKGAPGEKKQVGQGKKEEMYRGLRKVWELKRRQRRGKKKGEDKEGGGTKKADKKRSRRTKSNQKFHVQRRGK